MSCRSKLLESALSLAQEGMPVFPLVPGGKTPLTPNGFKDATTDADQITLWWTANPEANIGMLTAGLLVLDVDSKNGKDGFKELEKLEATHGALPATLTQTTPNSGRHYIFNAPADGTVGSRVNCPAEGLDIRGDGGYIVIAPSVINGVAYQLIAAPIADAPAWLVEQVRNHRAALKSVSNGDRISEGSRNADLFAIAMECNRNGLEEAAALEELLIKNVQLCNPPLGEDEVKRVVKSAYSYDTETPAEIIRMNNLHAVVNVGGKIRVMNHVIDPDTGRSDVSFSTPADLKVKYCNQIVKSKNGDNIQLGVYWLNHPKRKDYDGITFNPVETPKGFFNLWTGFAVIPKQGDCSKFLAHIRDNIASGDETVFNYIIGWMAHIVQKPSDRIGIALVMRGSMGTGKGVFANGYGGIFGRHYLPLSQSSQLTGKFNAHMKDKLLLFADESFWAGDKQAEGVLKSLITEPFLVIEGKGDNAYKIKNHLHFIFATNNDWCVPAGPQERRFFVLDVGEQHMQDHTYFAAIQKELDNGGTEALLHYLLHYKVGDTNLRKFPQTEALLEQKIFSMPPVQKYWLSRLQAGNVHSSVAGWATEIPKEWLYDDFIRFCSAVGVRHRPSDSEFGTQLKKLVPGITNGRSSAGRYGGSRKNTYRLPSLEECREAFSRMVNFEIQWTQYEEAAVTEEQEAA